MSARPPSPTKEFTCQACGATFHAGAKSRRVACSSKCSDAMKKKYDRDREAKIKSGELVPTMHRGQKTKVAWTRSGCGSKKWHVKFSSACRTIAAANGRQTPGYVTVRRPAEYLQEVNCG